MYVFSDLIKHYQNPNPHEDKLGRVTFLNGKRRCGTNESLLTLVGLLFWTERKATVVHTDEDRFSDLDP